MSRKTYPKPIVSLLQRNIMALLCSVAWGEVQRSMRRTTIRYGAMVLTMVVYFEKSCAGVLFYITASWGIFGLHKSSPPGGGAKITRPCHAECRREDLRTETRECGEGYDLLPSGQFFYLFQYRARDSHIHSVAGIFFIYLLMQLGSCRGGRLLKCAFVAIRPKDFYINGTMWSLS